MPPFDWSQILIAVASALMGYVWHKLHLPGNAPPLPALPPTPTPTGPLPAGPPSPLFPNLPIHLPDLQNPLVQGLLLLLKQTLANQLPAQPVKPPTS